MILGRQLLEHELARAVAITQKAGLAPPCGSGEVLQEGHSPGARHHVERWDLGDGTTVIGRVPGYHCRPTEAARVYRLEEQLYAACRAAGTVPVPERTIAGEWDGGPFLVADRVGVADLAGEAAVAALATNGHELINVIAQALASIHKLDVANPNPSVVNHQWWEREHAGDWLEALAVERDGKPLLSAANRAALARLCNAAVETITIGCALPVCHGDFRGANLRLSTPIVGARLLLAGVLDFELAWRWFPESDLVRFAHETLLPADRLDLQPPLLENYAATMEVAVDDVRLRFDWQRACSAGGMLHRGQMVTGWDPAELLRSLAAAWR